MSQGTLNTDTSFGSLPLCQLACSSANHRFFAFPPVVQQTIVLLAQLRSTSLWSCSRWALTPHPKRQPTVRAGGMPFVALVISQPFVRFEGWSMVEPSFLANEGHKALTTLHTHNWTPQPSVEQKPTPLALTRHEPQQLLQHTFFPAFVHRQYQIWGERSFFVSPAVRQDSFLISKQTVPL